MRDVRRGNPADAPALIKTGQAPDATPPIAIGTPDDRTVDAQVLPRQQTRHRSAALRAGFSYHAPDGRCIKDKAERARLVKLAVPPAYERVWISPYDNGHLQATGFDARGRKQYRYHPLWSEAQAQEKYASLPEFAETLPRIRRRVRRDLKEELGERDFALAAAVAMIDRLSLRVGNQVYAETNRTYGTLTLKRRHLVLRDGKLQASFMAKGGKRVRRQIANRTLMRALEKIRDLPGADLLTWLDEEGQPRSLTSTALNDYIAEAAGTEGFSAKTFALGPGPSPPSTWR